MEGKTEDNKKLEAKQIPDMKQKKPFDLNVDKKYNLNTLSALNKTRPGTLSGAIDKYKWDKDTLLTQKEYKTNIAEFGRMSISG